MYLFFCVCPILLSSSSPLCKQFKILCTQTSVWKIKFEYTQCDRNYVDMHDILIYLQTYNTYYSLEAVCSFIQSFTYKKNLHSCHETWYYNILWTVEHFPISIQFGSHFSPQQLYLLAPFIFVLFSKLIQFQSKLLHATPLNRMHLKSFIPFSLSVKCWKISSSILFACNTSFTQNLLVRLLYAITTECTKKFTMY